MRDENGERIDIDLRRIARADAQNGQLARTPCPCCGYLTFYGDPPEDPDDEDAVCPVCGWISDGLQNSQPKASGMPNMHSLEQSRRNFVEHGAAVPGDERVRPPRDGEVPK